MERIGKIPKGGSFIYIHDARYYLTKFNNLHFLLSMECPHQGGDVQFDAISECFHCPLHGWRFDYSGESITGGKPLTKYEVKIIGDELYTDNKELINKLIKKITINKNNNKHDLKISLVSHATLLIEYNNKKIITDPWFQGTAFNNSWITYPPANLKLIEIKPDVIIITHEHSDHLNLESINIYDNDIPIYYPSFPNKRIESILSSIGFTNLIPMDFGKKIRIDQSIFITSYEPASNFNDSIQLFELGELKLLNLNDAGINYKIADAVMPVDILSSTFGSGASGFPLCWTHLNSDDQFKILDRQFKSRIELLAKASKVYRTKYILPFASFMALVNPEHWDYMKSINKCRIKPNEISSLIDISAKVLDMLPGDQYNYRTNKIKRFYKNQDKIFAIKSIKNYINKKYNESMSMPIDKTYKKDLITYLMDLNKVPEIKLVNDFIFQIRTSCTNSSISVIAFCKNGKLSLIEKRKYIKTNVEVVIPAYLLNKIINEKMSWDEAYIGYWCQFHNENKFQLDFWRLLQAPYFKKHKFLKTNCNILEIPLQKILQSERSRSLLGTYGLYCLDCYQMPKENLNDAALKHGLSDSQVKMMVKQLSGYINE